MNMKGREAKGAPSADLLVCFPSRAHLALMPKPICSPARPSEPSKRHHHHHHHHHKMKSSTRGSAGAGGSQASPLLWAKNKQMGAEISEPTSPKVTCAGQIKVRHKTTPCKSWQSVMEEIERLHKTKQKKKSVWAESFGFKKDVLQFLTCLRNIRFDFRCFGSFPHGEVNTDDEDDDEDEDEEEEDEFDQECQENREEENEGTSRTIFSKWFMVLQENNQSSNRIEKGRASSDDDQDQDQDHSPAVPPPNALLLMRCRSAPAKSWLEEKQKEEEHDEEKENDKKQQDKKGKNLKTLMEEESRDAKKDNLVVMRYDTDFYKISSDIAKETWVVGGMKDPFSRSRSWKR